MGYSPVHYNGNLLCSIDTESTGLKAGFHDILQLCVLPLGPDLKPSREFPHFEIMIRPESPQRVDAKADKVNKGLMHSALTYGIERWSAVELLREWFYKLKLPVRKKIVPLGANWSHDERFIREFMGGPESYEELFRSDYRDVQKAAGTINDMCDWHSEPIPFPKVNLSYLCSVLGVQQINKHDATGDALATAEVYRRLMRYKDHWNPIAIPTGEIPDPSIDQFLTGLAASVDKKLYAKQFLARTGRYPIVNTAEAPNTND